jgi:hypothetical protein
MTNIEQKNQKEHVVTSMVNDLCIWGRAGVIKPVGCTNAFDCQGCSKDRQVLADFEGKSSTAGKTDNRSPRVVLLMNQGKCRHMLSGLISYGLCSYGYNCAKCSLDQMIEDTHYLPDHRSSAVDATFDFRRLSN